MPPTPKIPLLVTARTLETHETWLGTIAIHSHRATEHWYLSTPAVTFYDFFRLSRTFKDFLSVYEKVINHKKERTYLSILATNP